MNRCIYCKKAEGDATFHGTEHVLPQAFGLFTSNPTLNGSVCDDCNATLGERLDMYLARGTHEGLLRFEAGIKKPVDYKPLGSRSTRVTRARSGRWTGAVLWYRAHDDELVPFYAPQVGFAQSLDGPFEWFPRDQLPTKERLLEIYGTGGGPVEFVEIGKGEDNTADVKDVASDLRKIGANVEGTMRKTMELGRQSNPERIENATEAGPIFSRSIAKICFNYAAFVLGAERMLSLVFDPIRNFILEGTPDERLTKFLGEGRSEYVRRPGDAYRIGFVRRDGILMGHVRLVSGWVYAQMLAVEPDGNPMAAAMHVYDLDSLSAERRYPPIFHLKVGGPLRNSSAVSLVPFPK